MSEFTAMAKLLNPVVVGDARIEHLVVLQFER